MNRFRDQIDMMFGLLMKMLSTNKSDKFWNPELPLELFFVFY